METQPTSQIPSGKNEIADFIEEHVMQQKPVEQYKEISLVSSMTGVRRNKVEKVANAHEKLKGDFTVSDTVRIIIEKSEPGTLLWSLAGYDGIPSLLSSFFLQTGGLTVRRILRLNLLNSYQIKLCSLLVCCPERRLKQCIHNPDYIVHTAKKCPCCLKKNRSTGCPFLFKRQPRYRVPGQEVYCYAKFFGSSYSTPRPIAAHILSKLPPSTWEQMVGDVKFSDFIIRTSIEARMKLYAKNDKLKKYRLQNLLIGWGEKDEEKQQQLVGQTFNVFEQQAATYTITKVMFGNTNNINSLVITSTLDGVVSPAFVVDVRSYRDGFNIHLKFSSIHPFPRMHRHFEQRYIYKTPIVFDKCPNVKLWATASSY